MNGASCAGVQDLVGVRAADRRGGALVAQQAVQLPPARERGRERGVVEGSARAARGRSAAKSSSKSADDSRRTRTDLRVTRSLTTSSPSSSKRTASTGPGGRFEPGRRSSACPPDIRWMVRIEVLVRREQQVLATAAGARERVPGEPASGGVAVLTTAKCATGTSRTGARLTRGSSASTSASSSGSSGMPLSYAGRGAMASSRRCAGASSRRATACTPSWSTPCGAVLAAAGDPEFPCMLRSAAKPLQALPAVRDGVIARYDLAARACGGGRAARTRAPRRTPRPSPRWSRARGCR